MMKNILKNKKFWKIICILAIIAYTAKNLFIGADTDEGYGIMVGYRLAMGDRLLLEMWEPHQTSAIFTAVFIRLFVMLTGGVNYLNLFLRLVFFPIQACVSVFLYKTIRRTVPQMDENVAALMGLLYYVTTPKSIFIPEYSNLHNYECPIPVLRKAIIFACITGFRRSDILALKWEDIKELPKGGWCVFKRMQKTKNMANVPIGDDLMEVIGPRGEGLVFNGLTTYMLTYPMKRWFNSIGIKKDLHFHCTRHTYATLSLALGTDIITIKNVLGHKQESTTMRYTKVVNPLKEQAAKRLSINTISQNTEQYEKGNF